MVKRKGFYNMIMVLVLAAVLLLAGSRVYREHPGDELTSPEGRTYRYKVTLSGTMPNASEPSEFTVLTDDKDLTFDEVARHFYSSDSRDHLDIYWIP